MRSGQEEGAVSCDGNVKGVAGLRIFLFRSSRKYLQAVEGDSILFSLGVQKCFKIVKKVYQSCLFVLKRSQLSEHKEGLFLY